MSEEKKEEVVVEGKKEEKKPEFSKEELLAVFDKILFEGEYTEEVKIKGKLHVTFRTRSGEETIAVSKVIDQLGANLLSTVQEQRAILNLGYSLVNYSGKDLTKTDNEKRLEFIKKLPVAVIGALADALGKFDRKVDQACREGEENF